MAEKHVIDPEQQAFIDKIEGKQLVLVYPTATHRNRYLSYLMNLHGDNLLYYRAQGEQTSLQAWLEDMISQWKNRFSKSLGNLKAPEKLAKFLADQLNSHNQSFALYWDELDRVQADADFETFMRSLMGLLAPQIRVIVSSRQLSTQPWLDFIKAQRVALFGTEARSSDLIFTLEEPPRPQVDVYGFGQGRVFVNGHEITNWDGILPRNIFFFLMDTELATRDQIFSLFWPELPVKEATNVFHVTKRKISERISSSAGDGKDYELTTYSGGFYTPSNKVRRHYDVHDFENLVERAIFSDNEDDKVQLFESAINLYRAPFLESINMPWVLQHREKLRAKYVEALVGVGRISRGKQQLSRAINFFLRALREEPQREDIHREVMSLYIALNRPYDAVQQYRFLERYLAETINIKPAKETRALFEQIKA